MRCPMALLLLATVLELEASEGPARFVQRLRAGGRVVIATLGTSLTGGASRWPDAMMEWLDAEFPGRVKLHNLGVGASASSHPPGRSGLDRARAAAALKPDVAFIEFATNDAYLPYAISQEASRSNLVQMVGILRAANPEMEIVVQTMNSVMDKPGSGPHATNRPHLASYSEGYRAVARELGLRLVDHYPVWARIMAEDPARFDRLVPDRIHPTVEAYREVLVPTLKAALLNDEVKE